MVPCRPEALVPLRKVAALLAHPSGDIASWPVASTVPSGRRVRRGERPAVGIRPETAAQARRIGRRIASELGVTGVLAVEMFVVGRRRRAHVLVNELMRPHNTGTGPSTEPSPASSSSTCAVLDLPLGSTDLRAPHTYSVMVVSSVLYDQPARALAATFRAGSGRGIPVRQGSARPQARARHRRRSRTPAERGELQ